MSPDIDMGYRPRRMTMPDSYNSSLHEQIQHIQLTFNNMVQQHSRSEQLSVINDYVPTATSPYTQYDAVLSDINKRRLPQSKEANIELLLVIDNSIYRTYLQQNKYSEDIAKKKIIQYFNILIALVNQRFETIDDKSVKLRAYICDILIAENRREAAWIELLSRWSDARQNSVVSASRALKRFQKWLRRTKTLPKHDHAIVVTSYILSKRRKQIDGLAYVGTMCKVSVGKSASIVQDTGDFQSVGVIAHELAHSLGVTHDGDSKNMKCAASNNNVMAPQNSHDDQVTANVFYFSKCSIRQFRFFLSSVQSNCLYNTPSISLTYNLKANPPGKLFDENTQCEMAFGKPSQFCNGVSRSGMCKRLWCTSPGEESTTCRSNNRLMALHGTQCGYGKHCHLGECKGMMSSMAHHLGSVNRVIHRQDNCPAGDFNFVSCRIIIRRSSYLCNDSHYREYCCESCRKHSEHLFR